MRSAELVRTVRSEAGLSLRSLADAAGVAVSTVHRIERGDLHPTLQILERIAEAAGMRLSVEPKLDYAASLVGLARWIGAAIVVGDEPSPVRMAAEFAHRFDTADASRRSRMISCRPPSTGDVRWDAFLAALAEWLSVRGGLRAPAWVCDDDRFLRRGWWVSPMPSMRAWEYAGSPVSFKIRGVYLHRDSLINV